MNLDRHPPLHPPRLRDLLLEARVPLELLNGLLRDPVRADLPRGQGQTVLVLPGFGADARYTWLLRHRLDHLGYRAVDWGLGKNTGKVPKFVAGVVQWLKAQPEAVLLLGWSLGGVIARQAARQVPDKVIRIVTLGSPLAGGPKYTVFARQYRRQGFDLDVLAREIDRREALPLPVPVTALYTRSDGIVGWSACIDRFHAATEHVEVRGSHMGMTVAPETFRALARALAR